MHILRDDIKRTRYARDGERTILIIESGDSHTLGIDIRKGDIVTHKLVQTLNNVLKSQSLRIIKYQNPDNHGVSFNFQVVLERLDERLGQISQLRYMIRRKNERIVELEDRIHKLQLMCREHNTPIPATKRNVPSSCAECDGAGNFKTNDDEWESCDACDGDGRLK